MGRDAILCSIMLATAYRIADGSRSTSVPAAARLMMVFIIR